MRKLGLLLISCVLSIYIFQLFMFPSLSVFALDWQNGHVCHGCSMVYWVEAGASGRGKSEDDPAGNITYVIDTYCLANSTIKVKPGIYDSQIERFPLTLDDEGLTLEATHGPLNTIICGPGIKEELPMIENIVIKVVANRVTITGFTIKEGNIGIFVISPDNVIYRNIIKNNWEGVLICEKWFIPDEKGPVWWRGSNTTVRGNLIANNTEYGISISGSSNNIIIENNITANKGGISIAGANNTVKGNIVTSNGLGISIGGGGNRIIENTIINSCSGALLTVGENNIVKGSIIENNNFGVLAFGGIGNLLINNSISNNRYYGIFIEGAFNTRIEENIIMNNGKEGIKGNSNNIIRNNIIKSNGFFSRVLSSIEELLPFICIATIITISLIAPTAFYLLKKKSKATP